jgi:MFS family permease
MIFYSSAVLAGAFGGIVAGVITANLDGDHGIAGWRWLFIVEGVITVGLATIAPFFLLDHPAKTKKLSEAERTLAIARLSADGITNHVGNENAPLGPFKAFFKAAFNWRLWVLAIPNMQLVGASSLAYFYPTLVKGLGYTAVNAQYVIHKCYSSLSHSEADSAIADL